VGRSRRGSRWHSVRGHCGPGVGAGGVVESVWGGRVGSVRVVVVVVVVVMMMWGRFGVLSAALQTPLLGPPAPPGGRRTPVGVAPLGGALGCASATRGRCGGWWLLARAERSAWSSGGPAAYSAAPLARARALANGQTLCPHARCSRRIASLGRSDFACSAAVKRSALYRKVLGSSSNQGFESPCSADPLPRLPMLHGGRPALTHPPGRRSPFILFV
jgi:hypothetical protein